MRLAGKRIGFALTGSYCTFDRAFPEMVKLGQEGAEVIPIISPAIAETDTRFGEAASWMQELVKITGHQPIICIVEAEPIGPQDMLDALIIAPCTGNTLAKLANGITDSPVLMAAKACLRNGRPVIIAVSTNDGLSMNAKNLGILLNARHIYWVPFGQDDVHHKPNSIVAHLDHIPDTVVAALQGVQIQPLLVNY